MIGSRSIIFNFKITDQEGILYKVIAQANKNYGLCDLIIPYDLIVPCDDQEIERRKHIRNAVLNKFQGCQLNNDYILRSLKDMLCNLLIAKL